MTKSTKQTNVVNTTSVQPEKKKKKVSSKKEVSVSPTVVEQQPVMSQSVTSAATTTTTSVSSAPASSNSSSKSNQNVVVSGVESTTLSEDFASFFAKLQNVTTYLSSLKSEFRALEKKSAKQLKVSQKASAKRKNSSVNRAPSGFVQPTLISDELAGFLGKDKGSKMARTEVTREINAYIRTNNLQDKENGRRINADNNLSTLLKLKKGEELTYFNLQRYMSPHFAKSVKAVPASSVEAPVSSA